MRIRSLALGLSRRGLSLALQTKPTPQSERSSQLSALRACDSLRQLATACDSLRQLATACDSLRQLATACDSLRQLATACDSLRQLATACELSELGDQKACCLKRKSLGLHTLCPRPGNCSAGTSQSAEEASCRNGPRLLPHAFAASVLTGRSTLNS